MSDSPFWSGLRMIYVLPFCLFLGVAIFIVLYDRMDVSQIWNSPIWVKLKTPLIIIAVVGFLVALLAYISYDSLKHQQAVQEYAQAQGWRFSRADTLGIGAKVEELFYEHKFDLSLIRTVETGKRNLYLFDCYYRFRIGTSTKGRPGTACLIQSDRFKSAGSPVQICPRTMLDGKLLSDQVDMGDSPFAREFIVQSKDPISARKIVNESVQSALLEHMKKAVYNPVEMIAIGPRGAVLLTGETREHERWHDLIDLARRIESAVGVMK